MPKRFVVGDVHGCAKALRTVIDAMELTLDDEVIFLGDYVDRGPDSKDCIEQIIDLQHRTRVITLRGNHEIMFSGVLMGGLDDELWLHNGGQATVASYGGSLTKVPKSHREFLAALVSHYETETEIFIHACYDPAKSLDETCDRLRYWEHLSTPYPGPHQTGRRVYVGHTPQPRGEILDLGHLLCVDTCCFGGGYLTALNLHDGSLLQSDPSGHLRRRLLRDLRARVLNLF